MEQVGTSVGVINCNTYTWKIPKFLETSWVAGERYESPVFFVNGLGFLLGLYFPETGNKFGVSLLVDYHLEKLKLSLKLDLIGKDTIINICTKNDVEYPEDTYYHDIELKKQDITPNFLHNGELRIRVELIIHSDDEDEPDAPPSLDQDLREEITRARFHDFVLECGHQEIPVYRLLLAARSDVFATMFSEEFVEAKMGRAVIDDVEFKTLDDLVKFCQFDQFDSKDVTIDLLAAATKYMIKDLVVKCEFYLCKNLSLKNAVDFFLSAYLLDANKLRTASKKFIINNFGEVRKTQSMKKLAQQHPDALMEITEAACQKNQ